MEQVAETGFGLVVTVVSYLTDKWNANTDEGKISSESFSEVMMYFFHLCQPKSNNQSIRLKIEM